MLSVGRSKILTKVSIPVLTAYRETSKFGVPGYICKCVNYIYLRFKAKRSHTHHISESYQEIPSYSGSTIFNCVCIFAIKTFGTHKILWSLHKTEMKNNVRARIFVHKMCDSEVCLDTIVIVLLYIVADLNNMQQMNHLGQKIIIILSSQLQIFTSTIQTHFFLFE